MPRMLLQKTLKKNYSQVSKLPIISKLYERDIYDQILSYIENFLSPLLFGFRKGHSTEQCLNVMIEKWKKALDQKKCTYRFIKIQFNSIQLFICSLES